MIGDVLLPEERGVTDGAVRDALALERALGLETKLAGAGPGRNDHRACEEFVVPDQDAERRHRPTVWVRWGVAHAVNAGSNMQALVNEAGLRLVTAGVAAPRVDSGRIPQQGR